MGVVTELVGVRDWDCAAVVVDLLGKMGANNKEEVAEVDFGGGWVNVD
jgi:hypothetical protein